MNRHTSLVLHFSVAFVALLAGHGAEAPALTAPEITTALKGVSPASQQQALDNALAGKNMFMAAEDAKKGAIATTTFAEKIEGFGGAGGIAAVFMKGGREVENAEVKNGVLRVDFKSKERVGGILETHYLFNEAFERESTTTARNKKIKDAVSLKQPQTINDWAPGIMVGVELGENAIRSLGVGLLSSWQRFEVSAEGVLTQKVAFNLGVMVLIEQNIKMLDDGLVDGSALPAGMTDIKYKRESRTGLAFVFSAGF